MPSFEALRLQSLNLPDLYLRYGRTQLRLPGSGLTSAAAEEQSDRIKPTVKNFWRDQVHSTYPHEPKVLCASCILICPDLICPNLVLS